MLRAGAGHAAHVYRQDLFDLVWSEPTRTIAKRLGISDVGLAKACRRADLLLPPRGYWAKLAAGKTVKKPQLPRRGPGMSDRIVLGRDRWSWGPDAVDLSTPDPPPPTFPEALEGLAGRLREQVGAVRRTRDLGAAHARIQKLLDADEHRRARQAESRYPTFDDPVFETSFEKRRLRILNSLLRALDRLNVSVSLDGREARTLVAHVGDFSVGLPPVEAQRRSSHVNVLNFRTPQRGKGTPRLLPVSSCLRESAPCSFGTRHRQRPLSLPGVLGSISRDVQCGGAEVSAREKQGQRPQQPLQ
jgi:hypothetical protein